MRLFAILLLALFTTSTALAEDADFCASPAQSCGGAIPAKCLSTLGAGSVSASQDCASHLGDYRECLASVAERCSFVREEEQQQPRPQHRTDGDGDWQRQFDGRVANVIVMNPTLYGFQITLWHPDNGQVFGVWKVDGQKEVYLLLDKEKFSIGNDWGIQFGDAPARSVGEATDWTGDAWRASPSRFFQ